MKKIVLGVLIVLMLIFSSTVMAESSGYFEARLGADFFGELELNYEGLNLPAVDVATDFSLIGEYKVPLEDSQWSLGAGITYQLNRDLETGFINLLYESSSSDTIDVDFSSTALYALLQYDLANEPIYLVGKLGYSIIDADISGITDTFNVEDVDVNGGLYYGVGLGYNIGRNYVIEGLYSVNKGDVNITISDTNDDIDLDLGYSKFTLSLGMKF
ncbi:outer membrane beta-barrel protein [Halanaerobium hydrogeniformans]|uniref:Outer membrane protein beta-barrel domain-containing protein n=1 Tax=Halanaerobium hydrogeniformans TaxID=656519 RepID=E4RPN2_HALHG|nr:outer membrane beta-barrel protein [Halanaerobium hydrogeniformans]ADQ13916.1 hypothetical protein Halsa_0442 [Halanaerobium hydrogeniformans]